VTTVFMLVLNKTIVSVDEGEKRYK
jgi:hypothetical protein